MTRNYYRNIHASLLVFSVDDPASLQYLGKWTDDCNTHAPKGNLAIWQNKMQGVMERRGKRCSKASKIWKEEITLNQSIV